MHTYGYYVLHKLQADHFVGKMMQNNCVHDAVISKMFVLQYDVHNDYLYKQQ